MRKWFKYGLAILAVCLVLAFFGRERMTTMFPVADIPDHPVKLFPPISYAMFTDDGVPDDDKKVQVKPKSD